MRWRNHKLVTASAVYSLTGGMIATIAATIGSVLPDVLECGGAVKHRTVTHSIWGWVVVCIFLWLQFTRGASYSLLFYVLFFVASGAVMHICEDALSIAGIPLKTPYGNHIGLKVYRTGTIGEEITVAGLVVIFAAMAWWRGFFDNAYFQQQLTVIGQVIGGVWNDWS